MKYPEFLDICRNIKDGIKKEIEKLPQPDLRLEIGIGKDGTPTKKVDKIAEDVALGILREYDFKIITEESGVVGDGDIVVALDPVDGTFNASRNIPIYSVSLCFSESELLGDAIFGYVANLATDTEYYSYRWNCGKSFKDGKSISVSSTDSMRCNAIFYYPDKDYGFKRVRIFGSAALELCFVADGSVDCFVDIRSHKNRGFLRIYDVAAGLLISRNAGAITTDLEGRGVEEKRFTMDERLTLVVANKNLHDKIIKRISESRGKSRGESKGGKSRIN
ncbi:inositol monophosphatase [Archaeoglobales archaeon]|nr:MAG: inositol monophosphatase [Archaeoglobales archaeon]